jgi:molybdopterin molybdotransferase
MDLVNTTAEVEALIKTHFEHTKNEVREFVALKDSLNRILYDDIFAKENTPGFDRSTMDGYAVVSSDTFGASTTLPAMLTCVGEVIMGEDPPFTLRKGQTAYIPTGGRLPTGADGVIMVEMTSTMGDDTVLVETAVSPGTNVIFRGDDVKIGERVLSRGRKLRSSDIGTLAALGISKVPVYAKLKVGVISTGDELVDIESEVSGSRIRDVNSYMIASQIEETSATPVPYGIVPDDKDKLKSALETALSECDIVLMSGGSSVGTMDMTASIIDEAGEPGVFVKGVAIRPGKPTIIGSVSGKPVFGLPGNPVSAYFIFRVFVSPLIRRMSGEIVTRNEVIVARLKTNVPSSAGREEYVPVNLEKTSDGYLADAAAYKSGLITALSSTDGFIRIDRNKEGLAKGELVEVTLTR